MTVEGRSDTRQAEARVRRTFAYRIYPTKAQQVALEQQLREGCDLYNAALQHRRDAWREHGQRVSAYRQALEIKHMRAEGVLNPARNHWSQREPLYRLDRAFDAFFRRLRAGETPGYPRFRSIRRFNSLWWGFGNGCRVRDDGRLASRLPARSRLLRGYGRRASY